MKREELENAIKYFRKCNGDIKSVYIDENIPANEVAKNETYKNNSIAIRVLDEVLKGNIIDLE